MHSRATTTRRRRQALHLISIVFKDGGKGTITQSGEPVEFTWTESDNALVLTAGKKAAHATRGGDPLTFRAGDFSGDKPVVFTRTS